MYFYILIFVLIAIVYPIQAIIGAKSIKKFLLEFPEKKVGIYQQTLLVQVILCVLIFIAMYVNQDGIEKIGLVFIFNPLWMSALILLSILAWWLIDRIEITPSKREQLHAQYREVLFLLPVTSADYRWSVILAFSVGIMEEIIFRGFLFWQLTLYIPIVAALFLTNFIFALCHSTTGLKNALYTLLLGLIASLLFIWTNSLWLPIILHILLDLYATTMT